MAAAAAATAARAQEAQVDRTTVDLPVGAGEGAARPAAEEPAAKAPKGDVASSKDGPPVQSTDSSAAI